MLNLRMKKEGIISLKCNRPLVYIPLSILITKGSFFNVEY